MSMRIGIMLRSIDEKGGIGVYAANILRELLEQDDRNEYLLYFASREHMGRYADRPNVTERLLRAPHKAFWDQVVVPTASWRDRLDVLFHPKFTVPFVAPCPTVMVVHGADWFMPDQAVFYHPWDVRYIRTVMPIYFRRAALVLSVSELTTRNFKEVLDLPPGKIVTTYFGPAKHFGRVKDPDRLREVRERYDLPERFIFTLTKLGDRNRKNFSGIAEAYALYHGQVDDPLPLVVGGKDCDQLKGLYAIPEDGWGADVRFPGWMDQMDLPAVYSAAELFLYPSNLEAFPIPVTESLVCGTPLVTSDVNGLQELAGEAAEFVDPRDPAAIAAGIARVAGSAEWRASLSAKALERSRRYSWERCGAQTLQLLEEVGAGRGV